ncbi:GntR family transcriptional regulator [Aeromicrobium sp.]|uniref:GntR family transcriptional regulator n=1 Tax=Aeromicrobium sp. TaxID=1871063 RepID=UPI003D6B32D3
MTSSLDPIVQDSTPTIIARRLREAVATGQFQPGQQLQEASLAARLGVSRGPLREAMQRLTQEGLLVSHRNRGLFVMELDEATIRDIYMARGSVERTAIRTIVGSGWADDAAALLQVVDAMRSYDADPTSPEVSSLDMTFHETLVALSRSPRLMLMHGTLLTQVRLCMAWMQGSYDTIENRVNEHAGIAEAILAGDADLADRLLVEHMEDGLQRVLSMVQNA